MQYSSIVLVWFTWDQIYHCGQVSSVIINIIEYSHRQQQHSRENNTNQASETFLLDLFLKNHNNTETSVNIYFISHLLAAQVYLIKSKE